MHDDRQPMTDSTSKHTSWMAPYTMKDIKAYRHMACKGPRKPPPGSNKRQFRPARFQFCSTSCEKAEVLPLHFHCSQRLQLSWLLLSDCLCHGIQIWQQIALPHLNGLGVESIKITNQHHVTSAMRHAGDKLSATETFHIRASQLFLSRLFRDV